MSREREFDSAPFGRDQLCDRAAGRVPCQGSLRDSRRLCTVPTAPVRPAALCCVDLSCSCSFRCANLPPACPRYNVRLAVWLIGLLFDEPGSELEVHALLDGGALVVGDVDLACQLDEFAVERLLRLLAADAILDVPQ